MTACIGSKSQNAASGPAVRLSSIHTSFDREWDLDILGNWESITVGGTAENRTHNDVNEITAIDSSYFTHDPAGNLRQQPLASATRTYTHDAWNRLVKIEEYQQTGDHLVKRCGGARVTEHGMYIRGTLPKNWMSSANAKTIGRSTGRFVL